MNWVGVCNWTKGEWLKLHTSRHYPLSLKTIGVSSIGFEVVKTSYSCFFFFFSFSPRLYCHFVMEAIHLFPNFTRPYRQGNFSWDVHVPKVSSTPDLDDFWGNLGCENGLCLYCCDQKATGEERVCFILRLILYHRGKAEQETTAGTWGQELTGRARMLLVTFFLITCSACSLITLRTTSPRWQCLQWTESAHIINHENKP